jgi:hypothetical protein
MNTGTISNQGRDNWRVYRPSMLCAANGAVTHPVVQEAGSGVQLSPFGRWTIDDDGLVTAEIMVQFIGSTTIGSGSAYVWSLPVKARRGLPGAAVAYPLGTGMSYFSFAGGADPRSNVQCIPTLADPWTSLGGAEDFYCQMIAPYVLDWGTGTIGTGSPSVTVNHRAKYAFSAQDVEIIPTDASTIPTTSPYLYVTGISSTQMTVSNRGATAPSGSGATFSWKVRGEPPANGAYVSPTVPWDWSRFTSLGPFGNFFIQINYEAA